MNAQTNDIQWYIARDGKQHGPLTDIEMRTFVAHNYLRATDLIWRPGMPEWLPATNVFPAIFQPAAPQPIVPATGMASAPQPTPSSDFDSEGSRVASAPAGGLLRRIAMAAVVVSLVGGSAFAIVSYREPLMRIVTGTASDPPSKAAVEIAAKPAEPAPVESAAVTPEPAKPTEPEPPVVTAPPAEAVVAAVPAIPEPPAAPPSIVGSQIDLRLQKIPAWATIKKNFPEWYVGHIAAAEKLSADKKPDGDIALHLAQGLVTLRRQNAEKALAASPEKLKKVASAFLENLRSLRAQSVSACYGFISKGETSPAVVQLMEKPEAATALNTQVSAIFDAISDGTKSPAKHAAAVKGDYDILIKELGKLGWKEEDLQVFSNPRLLSKREPDQVCRMVQDWFTAHLAVQDKAAQDRLLYETLKPVVAG